MVVADAARAGALAEEEARVVDALRVGIPARYRPQVQVFARCKVTASSEAKEFGKHNEGMFGVANGGAEQPQVRRKNLPKRMLAPTHSKMTPKRS